MTEYSRSKFWYYSFAVSGVAFTLGWFLSQAIVPAGIILIIIAVTLSTVYSIYRSETQFDRIMDCNMISMGIWTATGGIIDANDTLLNLLGYTRQELTQEKINWREVTPPEYRILDDVALKEIQARGCCTPFEKEYVHKDGHRIPIVIGGASFSPTAANGIFFVIDLTQQKQTAAALRDSQSLFASFMRYTPTNVFIKDEAARYIFVNHRVEQEFDRPLSEWVGKTDFELFPPDLAQSYYDTDATVLTTGQTLETMERLVTQAGERYVRSFKFPLQNAEGKQYMAGSCVDITDRIRMETLLRQREAEMQLIADAVPALISYVDADQCYRFNNREYERWSGKSAHETYGKSLLEVLGASTYAAIQPYVERVLTGQPVDYEAKVTYADGKSRYIQAAYTPCWDEQGVVEGFVALVNDISDRKQAEQALENALRKLNSHVENTPLAVVEWDHEYRLARWSPQAEAIYGWQAEEVLGKQPWQWNFICPEDEAAVRTVIDRLVDGTERRNMIRNCNYTKNSSIVFCEWYNSALYDATGRLESVLCLVLDVTERKRIETERLELLEREHTARVSAERANRAKDEFLAILSHELRTPLNSILGWTQLMKAGSLSSQRIAQALETIERNANIQAQLVEDLLNTTQILQGQMQLQVCPLNLAEPLEAAIEQIRDSAKQKNITVQITLLSDTNLPAPELRRPESIDSFELDGQPIDLTEHLQQTPMPPRQLIVLGDAQRLQKAIWNLLTNAIKFTPAGGRVEIKLEKIYQRHNFQAEKIENSLHSILRHSSEAAQITISDSGVGISSDDLPHIFDRFYQSDSTDTRKFNGLGLGLAIVSHIIELHGGTVTARSGGIDQGTTFTVTLPLLQSHPNRAVPSKTSDFVERYSHERDSTN